MGFKIEQTIIATPESVKSNDRLSELLQREIHLFGSLFNSKQKEAFYCELSVLLKAGIHLREALDLLHGNQKKEKLKLLYFEMLQALDAGQSFSEFLKCKKEFTEYEYYAVQIGEETGNLIKIFEELGAFFKRKNEQKRSLMNALTYPVIIFSTAILVVIFMLTMVVPMFEDIFKQNNVELPAITKLIIAASGFLKSYGWLFFIGLILVIIGQKTVAKKETIRRKKGYFVLKLPYFGNFIRSVYLAQFTQAVALLSSSKVPILNSIQMVKRMINFFPMQDALGQIETEIMQGASLYESLKSHDIFDHKMASLVKVAEETNQTEFVFERLNEQYTLEVQEKSKLLSTLLEPLIIVVIGIFVGVILISMYLPMFKLSSVLG